jgi:hypothetical protein
MIKSFDKYLKESESSGLLLGNFVQTAKESSTDYLDNIDDEEEKESAIDGYAHLVSYLYKIELLPENLMMKRLEDVVSLGSVNTYDECKELMDVAFPGLVGEYGEINGRYSEIWKDKYWENSPGANSIDALEYEGARMCFWQDSGDGPYIYIKKDDLLEIMKKSPESIAMFPDAFEVLSDVKVDIKDFLYKNRGRIGGKKFGL